MSTRASLVMVLSLGAGQQDFRQFVLHLGIGQIRSPFFGHDDDVPRRQELFVAPEKFSQEALHPVAATGFAHLAPRDQPQPGAASLPRGQADAEVRRVQSFSPCLGPQVLLAAADPLVSGKAGRLPGCGGFTGEVSRGGGLWGGRERCSLRSHTERRLRPLARRLCNTRRPPLVLMRVRKPWVRDRRSLLG